MKRLTEDDLSTIFRNIKDEDWKAGRGHVIDNLITEIRVTWQERNLADGKFAASHRYHHAALRDASTARVQAWGSRCEAVKSDNAFNGMKDLTATAIRRMHKAEDKAIKLKRKLKKAKIKGLKRKLKR